MGGNAPRSCLKLELNVSNSWDALQLAIYWKIGLIQGTRASICFTFVSVRSCLDDIL